MMRPGDCARRAFFGVACGLAAGAFVCCVLSMLDRYPWFSRSHGLDAKYGVHQVEVCVASGLVDCVSGSWINLYDLEGREVPEMVNADIAASGACTDLDLIERCVLARHQDTAGLDLTDPDAPHYDLVRDVELPAVLLVAALVSTGSFVVLLLLLLLAALVVFAHRPVRAWAVYVVAGLVVLANVGALGAVMLVWDQTYDREEPGFWLYAGGQQPAVLAATLVVCGLVRYRDTDTG